MRRITAESIGSILHEKAKTVHPNGTRYQRINSMLTSNSGTARLLGYLEIFLSRPLYKEMWDNKPRFERAHLNAGTTFRSFEDENPALFCQRLKNLSRQPEDSKDIDRSPAIALNKLIG